MGIPWRQTAIFAGGALAGVLAGGWVALNADELEALWQRWRAPAAPQAQAVRQEAPCPGKASIAAAAKEDGQFQLVDSIAKQRSGDVAALIVIGKEAAASGRPRDAEVAFIMACRVAIQLQADPVQLADSKYQLAWHYANTAKQGPAAAREDLSSRARVLYGDALRVYHARLGKAHEKARFAAEGLAALQQPAQPAPEIAGPASAPQVAAAPQVTTPPPPPPRPQPLAASPATPAAAPAAARTPPPAAAPAPAPEPAPVARGNDTSASNNDTRVAGAGPAPLLPPRPGDRRQARAPRAPEAARTVSRLRPSFDCAKARSRTERLICSDAQLAQLDRELGRLHAQARAGAPDPADFKRRGDAEWRRREESCADRACLLAWYAHRRAQLLDEIDEQRAVGRGVAGR